MTLDSDTLSDAAFEVLRGAVTLARTGRFTRLDALEKALYKHYADQHADVDAALCYWKRNPPSLPA